MACRDVNKAEEALEDIKTVVQAEQPPPKVGEMVVQKLDLASLASVRECAKKILDTEKHIEILINNAGKLKNFFWYLFVILKTLHYFYTYCTSKKLHVI